MNIGDVVVYTPLAGLGGDTTTDGKPRYVVVSEPDDEDYVWLCEVITPDTLSPYSVSAGYLGDLTKVE